MEIMNVNEMNQCDGCNARYPLEGNRHIIPEDKRPVRKLFDPFYNMGRIHMICTAYRYNDNTKTSTDKEKT